MAGLSSLIAEFDDVLILTHERPDGDAIGSVLGLLGALSSSGRKAEAFFPEQLPTAYLGFVKRPVSFSSMPSEPLRFRSVVCLDCGNARRLGAPDALKAALAGIPHINIDHHPDNTLFGDVNYVDSNACSTSEILYRAIAGLASLRIPQDAATAFLLGVVMDTGGFRFDNTNSGVLALASSLISAGADYHGIVKAMFLSKPLGYVRLLSDIGFRQLRMACGGRLAFFHLGEDLLQAYGVDKRDTEGVIDFVRCVEGVEVTAMTVCRDGAYKVSLRSGDPRISVGGVARKYDGGGHELAAGCQIKAESPEKVFDLLVREFEPLLMRESVSDAAKR